MASHSPSGRRGSRPIRKPAVSPLADRSQLSRELEEIRLHELELKKKEEEMQRRVAELPRQIEEQERKQREMIRMRAVATATTADCFSRPRDKRYAAGRNSTTPRRRTRPEERAARIQFILLCLVLSGFLFLLCKSLPHH
jgi:hypothetical protein